ncbi:hypothetical protein ACC755_09750 [Rhizobium ruizarguesonis]|uniref:hypothetical protein n=1 Tax=Rhizobium ruizarguesonis TaxID=2081791 RepID=UPI00102F855A|nr:hypothetical protein [Rhizobium ruizarguesonis]TAY84518.1 hypothetical protein ELH85_32335 [Rhizobium ruizarguesonis]
MVKLPTLKYIILTAFFALAFSQGACAQADTRPVGISDFVYSASGKSLTILFVTAVILESAFAIIFNWRVFLAYFDTKGVKTILMIGVSLLVVWIFNLDVVASLVAAYTLPATGADQAALAAEVAKTTGPISKLITAFVLAGGSSGIHNMMYALGFRSSRDTDVTPKPPQDEAWVSVRVKRVNAVAPVQVAVSKVDAAPDDVIPPALAGTIRFRRPALAELLFRNVDRFPQNGGYVVEPNQIYRIQIEARDAKGTPLDRFDRYYKFAPRAIVDFDVEI